MRWLLLAGAMFGNVAGTVPVSAHPHVWIKVQTAVIVDAGSIVALRHAWAFDRDYLASVLAEYDRDRNGVLSADEMAPLLDASRKALAEHGYFTIAKHDGETIALLPPTDLRMEQTEQGMLLQFTIRTGKSIPAIGSVFRFEVYDPTFYSALTFVASEPVVFDTVAAVGCKATLALDPAGEQQKNIKAFQRQVGRVTAPLAPAQAVTVACRK